MLGISEVSASRVRLEPIVKTKSIGVTLRYPRLLYPSPTAISAVFYQGGARTIIIQLPCVHGKLSGSAEVSKRTFLIINKLQSSHLLTYVTVPYIFLSKELHTSCNSCNSPIDRVVSHLHKQLVQIALRNELSSFTCTHKHLP